MQYVLKQIQQAALIISGFLIVLFGVGAQEGTVTEGFGVASADAPSCTSSGESCSSCSESCSGDSAAGSASDCGSGACGDCGGGCF